MQQKDYSCSLVSNQGIVLRFVLTTLLCLFLLQIYFVILFTVCAKYFKLFAWCLCGVQWINDLQMLLCSGNVFDLYVEYMCVYRCVCLSVFNVCFCSIHTVF